MKKLLLIVGLLWSAIASAQFVPGQVLTAAELNSQFALYAPLTGATFSGPIVATAATQGFLDNSTKLSTTAFTKQTVLAATAEIPIASFTGGTYNFASIGSGVQLVVFASGGTISSILTIANPGTGYQVGDCLVMAGGNGDAIVRVTSVSGGGITAASPLYGGTGYTTGAQLTGSPLPPGSRTANLNGVLTSNATIIIPAGTVLQGARRVGFQNNTTGAFTTTVKLSNGAGGSTGTGVVLAQGTANSTSILLYTDGVTDVWPETAIAVPGTVPLTALAAQAANTVVANATAGSASPTALSVPSCSTSSSALQWNSGGGFLCNSSINSSSLGGATFAAPGAIGSTTSSTGAFTNLSSSGTVSGAGFNSYLASPPAIGGTAAAAGSFTSLTSTSGALNGTLGGATRNAANFTTINANALVNLSTTAGIAGTTLADNAQAGSIGEYLPASAGPTSLTIGVSTNIDSITLAAGDYDVSGVCDVVPAGTTVVGQTYCAISTSSGVLGAFSNFTRSAYTGVAGAGIDAVTPTVRVNISTSTTVFLVINVSFSVSTCTANGFIRARRVR